MDNFDYKKYLAEGRLLKENIADFLNVNYEEIVSKLGNPGSDFEIIGDDKVATAGDGDKGIDISFDKNHMNKLFPEDDPYNEVEELTIAGKVVYYNDYLAEGKLNEDVVDNQWTAYVKSLINDIRLNGVEQYTGFREDDILEDFENYLAEKM